LELGAGEDIQGMGPECKPEAGRRELEAGRRELEVGRWELEVGRGEL